MKFLHFSFFSFILLCFVGAIGIFIAPLLPMENKLEVKIVESGSMEPSIMTGSLVAILPAEQYAANDVVTFKSTFSNIPTTHRIVGIQEVNGTTWFTTKGDANEESDTNKVAAGAVLGKVVVAVPYVGFIFDFARQPIGFALLIVLPALLIVFGEIQKIYAEFRRMKKGKGTKKSIPVVSLDERVSTLRDSRMMDIASPVQFNTQGPTAEIRVPITQKGHNSLKQWSTSFMIVAGIMLLANMSFVESTVSYAIDQELSAENLLHAALLDFTAEADGELYAFEDSELLDNDSSVIIALTPEDDSIETQYSVSVDKISGNDLFCSALFVSTGEPVIYDGALLLLEDSGVSFLDTWTLLISLDAQVSGYPEVSECVVDVVFTAWPVDGEFDIGYSDEERTRLVFYTASSNPALLSGSEPVPSSFVVPNETTFKDIPEEVIEENENFETFEVVELPEIEVENVVTQEAEEKAEEDTEDIPKEVIEEELLEQEEEVEEAEEELEDEEETEEETKEVEEETEAQEEIESDNTSE